MFYYPANNNDEPAVNVRKYLLPELKTVFPFGVNPFVNNPQVKQWKDWAFESSLMSMKSFKKVENTGHFIDFLYPFCADKERYELMVKTMLIYFVFDDQLESRYGQFHIQGEQDHVRLIANEFDEVADKLGDFNSVSMINWKPYSLALYAVTEALTSRLNSVQRKRFIELSKYVSKGFHEEIDFIASDEGYQSLDQYTQVLIDKLLIIEHQFKFTMIFYR